MESEQIELEKRVDQLAKEVDEQLEKSQISIDKRFQEVQSQLAIQASTSSRIEKTLDMIWSEVASDKREKVEMSETEEIEEIERDDIEIFKTPPTDRKATSNIIQAYKHCGLVVRQPPAEGASGVESWLNESITSLQKAYPTLPSAQVIEVVSSRLPSHINAAIRTSNIEKTEKFVSVVTSIYSNRERGEEASRRNFYAYRPVDRTLIEIATDILSLSKNVTWDEQNRAKAINSKFISLLPEPSRIEIERQSTLLGETAPLLDLVSKIYQYPEMLDTIEQHFSSKAGGKKHAKQMRTGNTARGQNKGKPSESKKLRCRRCGSWKHDDASCAVYSITANEVCEDCLNLTGFRHFHPHDQCVHAKN